jgi:uncharacterized membrane protein (UPF0127 family)
MARTVSPAADEVPRRFRGLRTETVQGVEVPVADSHRSRTLGLALLPRERAGLGLLIPRCSSVHTFGMRFALDVLFLDEAGEVIDERRAVPPLRVVRCAGAAAVLELPSRA